MADFPGTQPSFVQLIDDPGGDPYQANQVNVCYNEIEALAAHLGAGTGVTAGGGIRLTLADGVHVIGYTGHKAIYELGAVEETVIPGGAWDVKAGLVVAGLVKPSSGTARGGISVVLNGESVEIYNDGEGNTVTLTVNAGGDVVVERTGGDLTYDVVLNFLAWM